MTALKTAPSYEAPDLSLRRYADTQGWQGKVVGMMTAAPMASLCMEHACIEGVDVTALVTTGINNDRRAGDKADVQTLLTTTKHVLLGEVIGRLVIAAVTASIAK